MTDGTRAMSDDERLLRSYHRLMYAYPGWYRRERRTEIVTTLVDAAAPGQRRPTPRDALDLLIGGLRCRLRLPRGVGPWLIATALAGVVGLAGAAAAVQLTSYPGPPDEADAMAAAAIVLPDRPPGRPAPRVQCRYWCPERPPGDDVIAYDGPLDRTDYVSVAFDPPVEQVPARLAGAQARLAAAGWTVRPGPLQGYGFRTIAASGAGLRLTVTGWTASGPSSSMEVTVTKDASGPAVAADLAGFLGGALAGWLATARVLRRRRRQHPALRAVVSLTGLPVLLFAAAAWYGSGNLLIALVHDGDLTDPNTVLLPALPFILLPPATVVAGLAACATMALASLPTAATPVDNRVPADPA